jgi:hypothetical protein
VCCGHMLVGSGMNQGKFVIGGLNAVQISHCFDLPLLLICFL